MTFNAYLSYRFALETLRLLRRFTVRGGVINIGNTPPPLARSSDSWGYDYQSPYNAMLVGRNWTLELTKEF